MIELRTFRLPTGSSLEIDAQHHRYLLYWVKHLAYDIQDTEIHDPKASQKFREQHDAYCAKAKTEQDRLNRPVGSVAYGGL